jgi:hypothetical protein
MKALEYYQVYHQASDKETADLAITRGICRDEIFALIDIRNVTTDDGCLAILREQNEKWNAMVRIFEKKDGQSPFLKDGVVQFTDGLCPYLKTRFPSVKEMLHVHEASGESPESLGLAIRTRAPRIRNLTNGLLMFALMISTLAEESGIPLDYDRNEVE